MRGLKAPETKRVRGIDVREDPARESCFQIVHLHEDVPDVGGMGPEHRRQRLHREYNQEVQNLEVACLCLGDFPEAPWELRFELARQCWDEARHAALIYRRLLASGGTKGQFAIANLDWSVVGMIDSLVGRLAVQHRMFEGGSLDVEGVAIRLYREAGDEETAEVMEAIEADEIQHVRFANEWLRRLTDESPRSVLDIATAFAWVKRVIDATGGATRHEIPTASGPRRLAGFTDQEVERLEQLEVEHRESYGRGGA